MPVLQGDEQNEAVRSQVLIPDARATHYWDGESVLGNVYGRTLELPRSRTLAWDIYFVFPAGMEWGEEVPIPAYWNHQLGRDELHLGDGTNLEASVREHLEMLEELDDPEEPEEPEELEPERD